MLDYAQKNRHNYNNKQIRIGQEILLLIIPLLFVVILLWIKKQNKQSLVSPVELVVLPSPSTVVATAMPTSVTTTIPTQQPLDRAGLLTEIEQLTNDKQGKYGWYVRSLVSQDNYGANFNFAYTAASINKIPIMINFLTQIEKGTFALDDDYILEAQDIEGGSGTLQYQKLGSNWSYRQLVELSGHYSDNTAINAINRLTGLSTQKLVDKYGLSDTSIAKNISSPADMSQFLKLIYNKEIIKDTILLELFYSALEDTIYEEDLIPEGIAGSVKVSHKIGWQNQVWSDCGIVFGERPFVLCIMTDQIAESEARALLPQIARKIWMNETRR